MLCSPLSMRLSGTLMSIPDCTAEPLMSCSFLTVSLPMCSSLLTWSSTLGISTLPAVRVRLVATCRRSQKVILPLTACMRLAEIHDCQQAMNYNRPETRSKEPFQGPARHHRWLRMSLLSPVIHNLQVSLPSHGPALQHTAVTATAQLKERPALNC